MKKIALVMLELFMLVCFAFGVIRILALLGEPQIMWNAILVGGVWCFLSLFVLIKTHKKRKGVQKPETVPQSEWKTPVVNNNMHTNGYERVTQPPTMSNFVPMQSPVNPVVRNTSTPTVPVVPREKRKVHPDELNPQEVIQRYLTTDHSKVSAGFDYYSYFRAEFECMMRSIPRVHIELQNEKVLRKQELLTPFEKTALITKHTAKQEVSNFVVIDTETTGIRTGGNDIIEVSAIKFENFVPVSMFTTLLKPRKPIPEDATRVNGITDEMVQNAPAFAQIKSALEAFVGDYPIVAHNAEFDVKFLHVSGMDFRQGAVFYDTLELSRMHIRDYDGTKLPNYKLATVCDECCIYFDGAHRSSADALATGLLFVEIVKAVFEKDNVYAIPFPATPITSVEELDDWDYYQTRKPVKTFTVTDRSEDAFAAYYSVGDEVEQGYDWEKDKDTLEIGYGAICNTPKGVQDFFDEHSGDYRLFVLDAYEDDNGRVKVKIGIFPEK